MPPLTLYEPYSALASVYQPTGLAAYAVGIAPRLLNLIFAYEWVGSAALELGCGTGEFACYLCEHGLRTFAVDSSVEMLNQARAYAQPKGLVVEWEHADIRAYRPITKMDLITCIGGTLNYLPTLADLEATFRTVATFLEKNKFFVFDLITIRGLSEQLGDQVIFDNGETITAVTRSSFSYETLTRTVVYQLWTHNGMEWRRAEEKHTLRGYPVQAIQKLLAKYQLKLLRTMNTALDPADPSDVERVVFLAQREEG
jgi:SAM-dependent methyltransferase